MLGAVESRDQIVSKTLVERQRRSTPYLTHQTMPNVASAGLPRLKVLGQSSTVGFAQGVWKSERLAAPSCTIQKTGPEPISLLV